MSYLYSMRTSEPQPAFIMGKKIIKPATFVIVVFVDKKFNELSVCILSVCFATISVHGVVRYNFFYSESGKGF